LVKINITKKLFGSIGDMELKVDTDINRGEFIALTGESGSGKSTLLRILAGLERANGDITVDGDVWLSKQFFISPQKRRVGFVFQDYALFPNMTTLQNLLYIEKDYDLANYLLNMTQLYELRDRYPQNLSGGQQQRVALARALMLKPKLLLMDEPLSAIDPDMRQHLQSEILALHREFQTTTIMVTHNREEVSRLADRVLTIKYGLIIEDRRNSTI
jgi:molybdate transport system ATP-binding protein